MTGKLYITNSSGVYVDVYKEFGVFLSKDSYADLISFPQLKQFETNNWPEEDGQETDLYAPALDGREFKLSFGAHKQTYTGDFITLLSDLAYHEFKFTDIGKTYTLRLVSMPEKTLMQGAETFSLQFADDFPCNFKEDEDTPAGQAPEWKTGYELDGRDLAEYGISILNGTLQQITMSPATKKNLSSNNVVKSGVSYDGQVVFYEPKDVALQCFMKAPTIERFWSNYERLLKDLIKLDSTYGTAERMLYCEPTGEEYACHYKSSSVKYFRTEGEVWCEFTLTLTFTSFRVSEDDFVLASEDGDMILTENDYVINMKRYGN